MTPLALWYLRLAVFYVATILACGYAARRGGGPERMTAGLILLGSLATSLMPAQTYLQVVEPLLVIDAGMLAGLFAVALVADRYWPLYIAAIQLLAVALHGVRAYDVMLLPNVYARFGGELVYPILLLLVLGTRRHVRRSPETDWLWQVRHEPPPAP